MNGDEEKLELQKDIVDFHAEMVMLLHFSVTNVTGIPFFNQVQYYSKSYLLPLTAIKLNRLDQDCEEAQEEGRCFCLLTLHAKGSAAAILLH